MGSCQNQTASYHLSRTTWSFISASRQVCFILLTTDQLSLHWQAYHQADMHLFDKCLEVRSQALFYALGLGREQKRQNPSFHRVYILAFGLVGEEGMTENKLYGIAGRL